MNTHAHDYMYYIELPEFSVGHIAGLPGGVSFIQLSMQHTDSN